MVDAIFDELGTHLAALGRVWSARSIEEVCKRATAPAEDAPFAPPPALVAFVVSSRRPLLAWLGAHERSGTARDADLAAAAAAFARGVRRWIQARNQYLPLGPDVAAAIDALHLRTLREVSALLAAHAGHDDETAARAIGEGLAAIADAHGRAVAGVLRALDAHGPGPGFAFKEVVCAAHAWELQLALLGLDPDAIAEPILDLGCGEGAPLVTALRARGKDAIGVDRITVPTSHVVETDWFEFPIAPDRYGTVISHLAFSTQFLHHHLRPEGDAERYARKYMEILRGLRDGGVFAYAPGLPFLEGLLPADRFRVETRPIETPIPGPFGPVHATKVTRVRRA